MTAGTMGRLSRPPHPVLFTLLYEPHLEEDRRQVLSHLLAIDAAHVVMLAESGLLERRLAVALLAANGDLENRRRRGEDLFAGEETHRGLYALYEQELIARLGPETGGAAHLARSRNDINAAVTRLRLLDTLADLLSETDRLLAVLARLSAEHARTLMSGFTHLEPAQPTSFGHYLCGVLCALTRAGEWLAESLQRTDCSPLGAAAGFGTSFPIDPGRVAELLGFSRAAENSLDAVASRDFAVHALAGVSTLGIILSRLAQDLQTWASAAYRFLSWPDELVSTSSIMPQKRNAYVLENVRGQATAPLGALVNALAGMKNVPFANSVEVSGEAASHLWPACRATDRAVRLTRLMVEHLEVAPERMEDFLAGRQTTMTALANALVSRCGLAFRTAHQAVGRLLQELPAAEPSPAEAARRLTAIVSELAGRTVEVAPQLVAENLDPLTALTAAAYGGGPAPESVGRQLEELAGRRASVAAIADGWRRRRDEARQLRQAAAAGLHSERGGD